MFIYHKMHTKKAPFFLQWKWMPFHHNSKHKQESKIILDNFILVKLTGCWVTFKFRFKKTVFNFPSFYPLSGESVQLSRPHPNSSLFWEKYEKICFKQKCWYSKKFFCPWFIRFRLKRKHICKLKKQSINSRRKIKIGRTIFHIHLYVLLLFIVQLK